MQTEDDQVVTSDNGRVADVPAADWVSYVLFGLVFAGAVTGMMVMGYLADRIGRRRAMLFTLSLTVVGSLGSAILPWGTPEDIYAVISACRFILGVGVGGIYPLSAVQSAEGSGVNEHKLSRVGKAFFWQTPGSMAPYAVAWCIVAVAAQTHPVVTQAQFRVVLGLGALPALAVFFIELKTKESLEFMAHRTVNPIKEALRHKQYWVTLVGTGGTWSFLFCSCLFYNSLLALNPRIATSSLKFLYDISYYGTAIFTPEILKNIFGSGDSLNATCWQSLVVSGVGLPGAVLAIASLRTLGGRWLNFCGFWVIAVSFAALAIVYQVTGNEGAHEMKFVLFCIITFALNFGPNVGTYVLPTACYPVHVRGTFHGLSAACAKVGAMVGTFMYKPISDRYGFATVLWVQVVLSIMGAAVSYFCLADDCKPQSVSLFDVQDTEPFLRFSKSKKSEPPGMQNGKDNAFY